MAEAPGDDSVHVLSDIISQHSTRDGALFQSECFIVPHESKYLFHYGHEMLGRKVLGASRKNRFRFHSLIMIAIFTLIMST